MSQRAARSCRITSGAAAQLTAKRRCRSRATRVAARRGDCRAATDAPAPREPAEVAVERPIAAVRALVVPVVPPGRSAPTHGRRRGDWRAFLCLCGRFCVQPQPHTRQCPEPTEARRGLRARGTSSHLYALLSHVASARCAVARVRVLRACAACASAVSVAVAFESHVARCTLRAPSRAAHRAWSGAAAAPVAAWGRSTAHPPLYGFSVSSRPRPSASVIAATMYLSMRGAAGFDWLVSKPGRCPCGQRTRERRGSHWNSFAKPALGQLDPRYLRREQASSAQRDSHVPAPSLAPVRPYLE
jgi:hypothetical protein